MKYERIFNAVCATERALQKGLREQSRDDRGHIGLYINGEIDTTTAAVVSQRLHAHPHAREITVHIDSPGGLVSSTHDIVAALWAHSGRTTAKIKNACSGALLVALACDRRIARPDARLLHHSPHNNGVAAGGQTGREINAITVRLFARAGISSANVSATLKRWGDQIRYFTAEEARALGIVTAIENITVGRTDPEWSRAVREQNRLTPEGRAINEAALAPFRERQLAELRAKVAPMVEDFRRKKAIKAKLAAQFGWPTKTNAKMAAILNQFQNPDSERAKIAIARLISTRT